MAWLYYPNEFERSCLNAAIELSRDIHKKNFGCLRLMFHDDSIENICGYDVVFDKGLNQKTIAKINSMMPDFPHVDEVGEGTLSDDLKTQLYNNPKRSSYIHIPFPKDEMDALTLWYSQKNGDLKMEVWEDNFDQKFPKYSEWISQAESEKKFDKERIEKLVKEGLKMSLEAHVDLS